MILFPFRVSKPWDPCVQFPPASEAAKAILKAKEAEEQGSLAVVSICSNKISYHECLGRRREKVKSGNFSQPWSPPLLSLWVPLLLSVWTKHTVVPKYVHAGSASVPLHRLGLLSAVPSCPSPPGNFSSDVLSPPLSPLPLTQSLPSPGAHGSLQHLRL